MCMEFLGPECLGPGFFILMPCCPPLLAPEFSLLPFGSRLNEPRLVGYLGGHLFPTVS